MKRMLALAIMLFGMHTLMFAGNIGRCKRMAASCLKQTELVLARNGNGVYVYKSAIGNGFAIISENAGEPVVLGYSLAGTWNERQMPPLLTEWLNWLTTGNDTSCRQLCKPPMMLGNEAEARQNVLPLVTSRWHQNSPYNDLCPIIEDGHVKTVAGCVAIAAAQIVNYWKRDNPEFLLMSTPTYPYGTAPVTLSIPEGEPNNWELILDSYSGEETAEQRNAVAQLVYAVGTTSYLNYGTSTGGQINDAANAVYSLYRLQSEYLNKTQATEEDWESLMYDNMERGFPVMYAGTTKSGSAHAFVLDGYDASNGLYHFNFGWGGSGDGYYSIDNETGVNGYCTRQSAVYNMMPEKRNISVRYNVLNLSGHAHHGEIAAVQFFIKNNSTLPLRKLVLCYDTKENRVREKNVEIANDGKMYTAELGVPDSEYKKAKELIVLDENGTEIYRDAINTTGIPQVSADERTSQIFGIDGIRTDRPIRKGIFIKNGRKIIK